VSKSGLENWAEAVLVSEASIWGERGGNEVQSGVEGSYVEPRKERRAHIYVHSIGKSLGPAQRGHEEGRQRSVGSDGEKSHQVAKLGKNGGELDVCTAP